MERLHGTARRRTQVQKISRIKETTTSQGHTRWSLECPLNEAFTTCSRPDVLCGKPQVLYCTKLCGIPACRCKTGYARETNGKCVLMRACRQKPIAAVPRRVAVLRLHFMRVLAKCAVNKRFVLCSTPEGTCTLPAKTAPIGHPQCQCIPGYVRAGALCIAKSSCPAPKTTSRSLTWVSESDFGFPASDRFIVPNSEWKQVPTIETPSRIDTIP